MSQHDLSENTAFELLTNGPRRHVVEIMAAQKLPLSFSELVAEVSAMERAEGSPESELTAVATRLHHVDLPKLSDCGIIEYDTAEDCIRATDRLFMLEQRLDGTRNARTDAEKAQ
jgi:hypothetical protein